MIFPSKVTYNVERAIRNCGSSSESGDTICLPNESSCMCRHGRRRLNVTAFGVVVPHSAPSYLRAREQGTFANKKRKTKLVRHICGVYVLHNSRPPPKLSLPRAIQLSKLAFTHCFPDLRLATEYGNVLCIFHATDSPVISLYLTLYTVCDVSVTFCLSRLCVTTNASAKTSCVRSTHCTSARSDVKFKQYDCAHIYFTSVA